MTENDNAPVGRGEDFYNANSDSDYTCQFADFLREKQIIPPAQLIADGNLHRCDTTGKNGKNDASYLLHLDGIPAGFYKNFQTGEHGTWCADIGSKLTLEEQAANEERFELAKRKHEEEVKTRHKEASIRAKQIWDGATPVTNHPYLTSKGIKSHGVRVSDNKLAIPLYNASGEICSIQFIDKDGNKKFLTGGQVKDCYFHIGKNDGKTLCIVEGFATGASIHEATGYPVMVAFSAGELTDAARFAKQRLPNAKITLCADDDWKTKDNPGMTKATEAANEINGFLATPSFHGERQDKDVDFNDLHNLEGLQVVESCINSAQSPKDIWPEPQPLIAKIEPELYPVDSLPDIIRGAVEEVHDFVQSPVAMIASSALAAVSLTCQAHVDVKRAEKLESPSGLFFLTIADSGERKTTGDNFFTKPFRDYEQEQREKNEPEIKKYEADLESWEAKRRGLNDAIRQKTKNNEQTEDLEAELRRLFDDKPEPPEIPRLLYNDVTPEQLAYSLAKQWPSGGIVSSEAGSVFGAHGMGKDSIMRNLSMLNILWDGGTLNIDRKTSESFAVIGARLTVGLQVQEATLRDFFDRSGTLARGSGFLARFLLAWPESTQGGRFFKEAPTCWPNLSKFDRKISYILNSKIQFQSGGKQLRLEPIIMTLSPEAKNAWIELYNYIEKMLTGELCDIKDVASKALDNVARLAALFQFLETGAHVIDKDYIDRAGRIVGWHLNESRRFFGELALPKELADAARLDYWLIRYCKEQKATIVSKRRARQFSPLRDKVRLDNAIEELTSLDRVQLSRKGKRIDIKVNPALIEKP